MEQVFTWAAAVFALIAGGLWVRSATINIPAPPETSGVGALMGGYLVSLIKGKRIDLHATLEAQSKWNAYAAFAATASAVLGALALVVHKT